MKQLLLIPLLFTMMHIDIGKPMYGLTVGKTYEVSECKVFEDGYEKCIMNTNDIGHSGCYLREYFVYL